MRLICWIFLKNFFLSLNWCTSFFLYLFFFPFRRLSYATHDQNFNLDITVIGNDVLLFAFLVFTIAFIYFYTLYFILYVYLMTLRLAAKSSKYNKKNYLRFLCEPFDMLLWTVKLTCCARKKKSKRVKCYMAFI